MRVLFAPHGRTQLCDTGTIMPPEQALNFTGHCDAIAVGQRLELLLDGDPLGLILTAQTARSRQTAELAGGLIGYCGDVADEPWLNPRGVPDEFIGEPANSLPWNNLEALNRLGVETAGSINQRAAALLLHLAGCKGTALLVGDNSMAHPLVQLAGLPQARAELSPGRVLDFGTLQRA